MRRLTAGRYIGATLAVSALALTSLATPSDAAVPKAQKLANQLVRAASADDANRHLRAFQRIASNNDGNRAAGTSGYDASAEYVANKLRAAGFLVETPEFSFTTETPIAESLTVGTTTFDVTKMSVSVGTPTGGITGPLRAVPLDDTTGCEASDYAGADYTGAIAVVRRGGCTFEQKQATATAAGAVAAVIYNNIAGDLNGTTGVPGSIPVGQLSDVQGAALAALAGQAATLVLEYEFEETTTTNVIAETRTGRTDNVVMAGAHLDSVEEGPGINDNGSGSAGLLDIALDLGSSPKVNNVVRFAWWGAEESGLLGAEDYVANLTEEEAIDIALYLNFDMIASPNAGYFVYDGDDSDGEGSGAGPVGSAHIERTFVNFLEDRKGVTPEGTDFDGRSDYGPFIAIGIPSGGLFTGAEGIKTEEQADEWGGDAGVAYDPCYHQACDDINNINMRAFNRNIDAAAWAIGIYAYSTRAINNVAPNAQRSVAKPQTYQGPFALV